jgi:uncharacterized protein YceK
MRYLLYLLAAATLSGCASTVVRTTPQWDGHFGADVRAALAQQTIHPDAGRNADPVAGMDGRAGRSAYERYQKASSEPVPQPSSFTVGVSGAK